MGDKQFLLHLSLLIISTSGQSNSGIPFICSTGSYECQDTSGQIDIVTNVPSIGECRQLCLDNDLCQFITYYFSDGFPGSKMCILLQGCESLTKCTNCESQNMDCFTMGPIAKVVGTLGDNVLDAIQNVHSAVDCKKKCSNEPNCGWFTYFLENDKLFPNVCFLQTEVLGPTSECEECLAGPTDEECFILYEGEKHQSLMLTDHINNRVFGFGSDTCQLKTFAVGAGGTGEHGGGGSGYFNSLTVSIPSGFVEAIYVYVGQNQFSESEVRIDHETCQADYGKNANGYRGGDGYSGGGGAFYSGDNADQMGGSNGSNGSGYKGGHGTNASLTSHQFFDFELSPGRGGSGSDYFECAGGGGGVLVNGDTMDKDMEEVDVMGMDILELSSWKLAIEIMT